MRFSGAESSAPDFRAVDLARALALIDRHMTTR